MSLGDFGKFKVGFKSISKARNFASSLVLYVFIYKHIYVYFYSKTQPDAQYLKFILFWNNNLHVLEVSPSIIRSLKLYIHASQQPQNLYGMYLMLYVQSDSWCWTERPSETCRLLFQNKINFRCCASGWCYYRNILRCTVLKTSNMYIYVCIYIYIFTHVHYVH
jgi:hypothetical protein